jgi:hypothetical protein
VLFRPIFRFLQSYERALLYVLSFYILTKMIFSTGIRACRPPLHGADSAFRNRVRAIGADVEGGRVEGDHLLDEEGKQGRDSPMFKNYS